MQKHEHHSAYTIPYGGEAYPPQPAYTPPAAPMYPEPALQRGDYNYYGGAAKTNNGWGAPPPPGSYYSDREDPK
jgi:hypothetical protein